MQQLTRQEVITVHETALEVKNIKDQLTRHMSDQKVEVAQVSSKLEKILKNVHDLKIDGMEKNYKLWIKIAGLSGVVSVIVAVGTVLVKTHI